MKEVRQWSCVCLDSADWEVFKTVTNSLDEHTEAVTSYDSSSEGCCMPTHTGMSNNNDQVWFTAELAQLRMKHSLVLSRTGSKMSNLKAINWLKTNLAMHQFLRKIQPQKIPTLTGSCDPWQSWVIPRAQHPHTETDMINTQDHVSLFDLKDATLSVFTHVKFRCHLDVI